jgi:uncharacterized repeat protein (TIGR03803 family)
LIDAEVAEMTKQIYFLYAIVLIALLGSALPMSAQTYTDLYNFDGVHGAGEGMPNVLAQGRDGNLYGTTVGGGHGGGIVFRITPSGKFKVLHTFLFDNTEGGVPFSGLVLGSDGGFYGTTNLGSVYNAGTIFKITGAGSLTTLYKFTFGDDGAYPYAPPVEGADGNFYGDDFFGDTYRITPSGNFTHLGFLGASTYAPLLLGTDGNFYGTTLQDTVAKMSPNGSATVLYYLGNNNLSQPYSPVIQANDGNFYGTTTAGGTGFGGAVFKLTPRGVLTVPHNFVHGSDVDGDTPTAGLLQGSDGNLYGVTIYGGTAGCGVIFRITPAGDFSVIYNFDGTNGGNPYSVPVQHTNGKIYGQTNIGGPSDYGVLYSLDIGAAPFVRTVTTTGKVGKTVGILGGELNGTTSVSFNGTNATYRIVSDTFISATIPAGATSGFVRVVTPTGTLKSAQKFQVRP